MSEIPLPSIFHTLLSMYGYFLPIMLYAAWSTLAFWDLGRREDLSNCLLYTSPSPRDS